MFTDWSKQVNEQFKQQNRQCLMLLDNASSHHLSDTPMIKLAALIALTDYTRKTQICVRARTACTPRHCQWLLHTDSRKRAIVTNRVFAKVK